MHRILGLTVLVAAIGLAACTAVDRTLSPAEAQEWARQLKAVQQAVAVMEATEGNDVNGAVYFMQNGDSVQIKGRIEGLEPGSTHGMHIHKYGDISKPNGTAAGGHYNPEDHEHGLPHSQPRHAGDLGNIEANDQGVAEIDKEVSNISIAGTKNPILGRGVIVHAKEDDGGQPTGNAGSRISQGVIGVDQAE